MQPPFKRKIDGANPSGGTNVVRPVNWEAEMDKPLFVKKGGGFVTMRQALELRHNEAKGVVEALLDESVAVDLDGTLARDSGWKGPEHIGEPVKPMLDLVKKLLDDGEDVVIFTARVHDGEKSTKEHIKQWLKDHDLPDLEITNEKRPDMEKFYDDKAVAVQKNKGVEEALLLESPTLKTLQKNKVDLEPDERKQIMKAKAVWPFGKKGADSPAVHKAVVKGKPWYWSSTHRLYHVDSTVAAAIKNFFKIVEPSG